jgi:hypothetical protein
MATPSRRGTRSGDDALAIEAVGPLVVVVWRGLCTQARLDEMAEAMREVHRVEARRLLVFTLIGSSVPLPGAREREVMRGHFDAMRACIEGVAIVVEGDGVLDTIKRALLTTVITLAKRPFAYKMFADPKPALRWLTATFAGAPLAATVSAAIARCDRRLSEAHEEARTNKGRS